MYLGIELWISGMVCRTVVLDYSTGLIPLTHGPFNVYSAQRLDLFARCVRLSQLLVGFRTHFKSSHFHSFFHFIHSFIHSLNAYAF